MILLVLRMKNEEKDTTYEVRLFCRNCKNDWIENIEKGIYVRYERDNNYMIKADGSSRKRLFKCPKCGANKKIARLPLT
jgi:hypothetical protein